MTDFLTVCMIAHNEEETLHDAIASAQRTGAAICLVDNGSTDGTPGIAKQYGATIEYNADRTSLSVLRNHALTMTTTPWVMILDGDEEISQPEQWIEQLQILDRDDVGAVYVHVVGDNGFSFMQLRAWHQDYFEYKYRAHEVPIAIRPDIREHYSDLVIWHHQPTNRWPGKLDITLARLILDVAENPGDSRCLYYLARQWFYLEDYARAIATFDEYFKCSGRYEDANAYWHQGRAKQQFVRLHDAKDDFYQAFHVSPHRFDIGYSLADCLYQIGHYFEAWVILNGLMSLPHVKTDYYDLAYAPGEALMGKLWTDIRKALSSLGYFNDTGLPDRP